MSNETIINLNANPILAALHMNTWYPAQALHVAQGGVLTPDVKKNLLVQVLTEAGAVERALQQALDEQKRKG